MVQVTGTEKKIRQGESSNSDILIIGTHRFIVNAGELPP